MIIVILRMDSAQGENVAWDDGRFSFFHSPVKRESIPDNIVSPSKRESREGFNLDYSGGDGAAADAGTGELTEGAEPNGSIIIEDSPVAGV